MHLSYCHHHQHHVITTITTMTIIIIHHYQNRHNNSLDCKPLFFNLRAVQTLLCYCGCSCCLSALPKHVKLRACLVVKQKKRTTGRTSRMNGGTNYSPDAGVRVGVGWVQRGHKPPEFGCLYMSEFSYMPLPPRPPSFLPPPSRALSVGLFESYSVIK